MVQSVRICDSLKTWRLQLGRLPVASGNPLDCNYVRCNFFNKILYVHHISMVPPHVPWSSLSVPLAKQVPLVATLAQSVCVRRWPAPGIEHMGERSVERSCNGRVICPETGLSEQRQGDAPASARESIGVLLYMAVSESRGGRTTSSSACDTAPRSCST